MKFIPKDYQERMLRHLAEHDKALLFVSPGLGKTAVALSDISDRIVDARSKGALVVAPLRVCSITWPKEVAKWDFSKWMRVANLRTPAGRKAWERGEAEIYLINPELLPSVERTIKCPECRGNAQDRVFCDRCEGSGKVRHKYEGFVDKYIKGKTPEEMPADILVIDEISLAKNHSGKRFKALRLHQDLFDVRVGLTGTPVPNDYQDLFNQLRMIDGGERLGRVFHSYQSRYFSSDYMGYKWVLNPGAKEKIDQKISDIALVMLGDDYLDIPTASSVDIDITLPAAAKKAYKELEKELLIELGTSDVVALNAAALANKLLQLVGGTVYDDEKNPQLFHTAKIDALKDLRKKLKDEPLLVFVAYKHEMDRVLEAIPGAERFDEKRLADWQAGKIKTWVCQPQSMSHGIDGLQDGGKNAVWFTLTWSNETYLQANARLIRTGQSHAVTIYRLLASGTVDEAVAEALREKSDNQSGLLNALKALQALRKSEK